MSKGFSPTSISPILKGIIKDFGLEKGISGALLQIRWREIVGPQIASHTYPAEIRFDTLHLTVDSAVWMHQLSFLKKEIIEKCNRLLEKASIRKIQLRTGPLPPPLESPQEAPALEGECTAEEAAFIEQQIVSIPDMELKEAVRRALRRHLLHRQGEIKGSARASSPDRAPR
ncbi:MAG: DUF721 domain-containing protein [Candidatus Manganitrophus sp. SB1]|nr:DUF721 domain-containing protein [Candidatus Manganitrophus morganii]